MTREEIDALATRITELLARNAWVPGPVRPEPPGPPVPGHLPTWAGAAQQLSDVAPTPGRKTVSGRHRPSYDALTVAARAAAAGRGSSPLPGGDSPQGRSAATGRTLSIGVSNRHIHITQADFERLFGPGKHITPERPISQPGQFAAVERLKVTGPKGAIADVRIVGPARQTTQVELSATDCRTIGVDAPVRHSGRTSGSAGITLEGDAGTVQLPEGAIIAARHMHVATTDAPRLGVADGDRVAVVLGPADRRATLTDVLVRSGSGHATELHLDTDEANAFAVKTGDLATLIGRARKVRSGAGRSVSAQHRPLVTERDVDRIAARGETLSDAGPYRVTPLARDRARALGVWRDPQ